MRKDYEIPEYILILLNVSKYTKEEALKRAVHPNAAHLRDILENEGKSLLESDYYDTELIEEFKTSCKESFINPTKPFELKAGDWDLMEHVIDQLKKGKLSKQQSTKEKSKPLPELPDSYFNPENVDRINQLLKKDFPKHLLCPSQFSIKEISTLVWLVMCPFCQKNYNIHLAHYWSKTALKWDISFNKGNFKGHLDNQHGISKNSFNKENSNEFQSQDDFNYEDSNIDNGQIIVETLQTQPESSRKAMKTINSSTPSQSERIVQINQNQLQTSVSGQKLFVISPRQLGLTVMGSAVPQNTIQPLFQSPCPVNQPYSQLRFPNKVGQKVIMISQNQAIPSTLTQAQPNESGSSSINRKDSEVKKCKTII